MEELQSVFSLQVAVGLGATTYKIAKCCWHSWLSHLILILDSFQGWKLMQFCSVEIEQEFCIIPHCWLKGKHFGKICRRHNARAMAIFHGYACTKLSENPELIIGLGGLGSTGGALRSGPWGQYKAPGTLDFIRAHRGDKRNALFSRVHIKSNF